MSETSKSSSAELLEQVKKVAFGSIHAHNPSPISEVAAGDVSEGFDVAKGIWYERALDGDALGDGHEMQRPCQASLPLEEVRYWNDIQNVAVSPLKRSPVPRLPSFVELFAQ